MDNLTTQKSMNKTASLFREDIDRKNLNLHSQVLIEGEQVNSDEKIEKVL